MPVVPALTSSTTAANLVDEIIRMLLSGGREQLNKLGAAAGSSATSLSFTYDLLGIVPGSLISIDLEDYWVWDTNVGGKTATVEAGYRGSPTGNHPINSLVQVNPRWSKWQVFDALNREIAALVSEGLYRMQTVDLTASASVSGYDLTSVTDVTEIYKVLWEAEGTSKNWPEARWGYNPDMSTSEFASGKMIQIYDSITPGATIRVFYKSGFNGVTALTDNIQTITGIPAAWQDILTMGSAARLVEPKEVRRADLNSQGDSRRANEVEGGSQIRAGGALKARRDQRVQAEIRKLSMTYPPKMRV